MRFRDLITLDVGIFSFASAFLLKIGAVGGQQDLFPEPVHVVLLLLLRVGRQHSPREPHAPEVLCGQRGRPRPTGGDGVLCRGRFC